MSILGGMNIAKTALNVNQFALNVVSNNIANMNTEGYLKQRVELAELQGYTPYSTFTGLKIYRGGGVGISDISQYNNQIGLDNINGQNSTLSSLSSELEGLNGLADILNELGDGALSAALTDFYAAAQYLTQNPSDSVLRINYVNAAETVAEAFNKISSELDDTRSDLVGNLDYPDSINHSQAGLLVTEINDTLKQIAAVNDTILRSPNGTNELINQRNQLLQDLSSLVDFDVKANSNGTINIQIAGVDVVKGSEQACQLTISAGDDANPAKVAIQTFDDPPKVKVADIREHIDGGQLSGVLNAASSTAEGITFQKVYDQINLLAKTFAKSVNDIQMHNDGNTAAMAIGLDANGNEILVPSTEPLFVIPADGNINAANIKINQTIYDNPNLVAAARVELDAAGNPVDNKAIGDSDNLKEILNLQDKNFGELGGVTIATALNNLVTKVGLEANDLKARVDAQTSIVDQATTNYAAIGGVNLDEELIDMIKYQRAYEAASRVVTACNEMLQVLVTLGQ